MNKTLGIINKIIGKIYFAFAILVVLFAVVVTIARALSPILEHYKPDITHLATSYLHQPVHVGKITAGLRGFQPVLDLNSVVILDKDNNKQVFRVKSLQVGLDIINSIKQHKLIVSRLYLDGMHIVLQQKKDRQWNVKGFSVENKKGPTSEFDFKEVVSWLLSQPQIVLENINLRINPYQQKMKEVNDLDLALNNTATLHQFRGQADLAGRQSPIDLTLDLTGSADDVDNLQGSFYLHGVKMPVADWLADNQLFGYTCEQGNFSFKLWGNWNKDRIDNLQSTVNFSNLSFKNNATKSLYKVQKLTANLSVNHPKAGIWNISGDKIGLQLNSHVWPEDKFAVAIDSSNSKNTVYSGYFGFLQLQDLTPLFSNVSTLPVKLRELSRQLQLHGQLEGLTFSAQQKDSQRNYYLTTHFHDFGNNSYKKIPGVQHIDGMLNMSNHAGTLSITGNKTILDYRQLFPKSYSLNQLQLFAAWTLKNKNLHLQLYNVQLADANMALQSNADLYLAHDPKKSTISLLSQFQLKNVVSAKHYFPVAIMHKSLLKWLGQAFIDGHNAKGDLLLKGQLDHFPYEKNDGQFIVDSHLHGVTLQFLPDWPHITNLDGHLVFHQHQMTFNTQKGELMQQPITDLTAIIPHMNAQPYGTLKINSHVAFKDLAQARNFVLQSPLKNTIGKALTPLHISGPGDLNLKLTIPLGKKAVSSEGTLVANEANLSMPDWRLNFPHLSGMLKFHNASISAKALTASLYNEPITISIKTLQHQGQRVTQIVGNTLMKVADIKNYLSLQALKFMTGASQFKSVIDIDASGKTHLAMMSDLKGVTLDMPPPFKKTSQQIKSLQVDAYLSDAQPPLVRLTYVKHIGAILGFAKSKGHTIFQRAKIHFGMGGYILQTSPGIFISGNLAQFDLPTWSNFFHNFTQQNKLNSTQSAQQGGDLVKQIDINIGQLNALKQSIKNIHVQFNRQVNQWLVSISSQQVNGTLKIPFNYHKNIIMGQFSNLHLQTLTDSRKSNVNALNPADILPMDISAVSLSYAGRNYGQVTLKTTPIDNGVKLNQLSIVNKQYILNTHGRWTRENKQDSSSFSGSLFTDDLGSLLKQEGFSDHIYQTSGTADFSLSWPGEPSQFQTSSLEGALKLNLHDGAIIGLNDATNKKLGLGKLINILSVQSILKRLTLNFSDLNESGYSFSKLTGDLSIYNGNVYTQDLYLDGPVAEINLLGKVGMMQKNYDMTLKIHPYVTSSLPLIATIAGGPVTGVATWLVSKLVRPGIEKIVAYQYHIGGTWANPKVKEIKAAPVKKDSESATQ